MHRAIGLFSLFLTGVCFLGGLLHAGFGQHLGGAEKLFSYTFWIIPLLTTVSCFNYVDPDEVAREAALAEERRTHLAKEAQLEAAARQADLNAL